MGRNLNLRPIFLLNKCMDTDTVIDNEIDTTQKIKLPRLYKVVIHNDDHTPVEFVIVLLVNIFKYAQSNAVQLTLDVHNKGQAIAGIYPLEIAEQKVVDSTRLSRSNGFPLVVTMEPE